jgi:protein PsiE
MINNSNLKSFVGESILHIEKALLLFIVVGTVYAAVSDILSLLSSQGKLLLADLFLLFIYAEILGMVAAFYKDHRIPITLPVIIAITALTRMLVLTTKGGEGIVILYESAGILICSISAYILSLKEKLSLEKLEIRKLQS